MSRELTAVADAVAEAVKDHLPQIAASAIREIEADNPLAQAALDIAAGYVEKNGPDMIDEFTDDLLKLIDGDASAAFRLAQQGDAGALSKLTEAMQSAEAEHKANASKLARDLGKVIKPLAKLTGKMLLGVLA